jgi:hypothetical protein
MAVHKEETMLEKLNAVRPLFHLIVALTMQFVALSIVTPAIIGVIVEAICPPGHAECGRVIFLSGFQQMVHTWTHIVLLSHKHNSDLFQLSRNTQLMPNFISNCDLVGEPNRNPIPSQFAWHTLGKNPHDDIGGYVAILPATACLRCYMYYRNENYIDAV